MTNFGLRKNKRLNFTIGDAYVVLASNAKDIHHALWQM
jgi:hypothetical protein